jgi:hypothetical protein
MREENKEKTEARLEAIKDTGLEDKHKSLYDMLTFMAKKMGNYKE